jgi:hypothetical protein
MHTHQLRTITAATLTIFALVIFAAPAAAEPQVHSPDAWWTQQDFTMLYGKAVPVPEQDLRSPDTRDAALSSQGLLPKGPSATVSVDRAPDPAPVAATTSGFDWLDAVIGATGALGLVLIATGMTLAIRRRTHSDDPVAVA